MPAGVFKAQIIEQITTHIRIRGGFPSDWYLGVSQNPEARLLINHKVDIVKDQCIIIPANSDQEAKEILDYFVNWIGTDGRPKKETNGAKIVYAYKKSDMTNP